MKAIVNTPVCAMRKAPTWESTLEDEALYGMVVDILESPAPGWYRVRTHYRYEGIAPAECLLVGDQCAAAWAALPKQVVLHKNNCDVLSVPKVQGWRLLSLTRGCVVSPVGEPENGWQKALLADGRAGFVQAGILGPYYTTPPCEDEAGLRRALVDAALLYTGTHYRWGGKSPLGIDCSGLVSMAYLLNGIVIYRDAHIREDFPIHEIGREKMKPGDLLFFPGHVAMYIGDSRYCHSTGRAGDDGFAINSLDPAAPDFRADLAEKITQVGSYFQETAHAQRLEQPT